MHAPTGAARWFNRLDQDFSVSTFSKVQTLDFATTESSNLYSWWIRTTKPKHPVLADPRMTLLQQLQGSMDWPEVTVVDCEGKIAFRQKGNMDESMYKKVKEVVEKATNEPYRNPD